MTTSRPVIVFACILFLSPALAFAQNAAPTPVPDTAPDLSSMQYFLGTWKCTSKTRGSIRPDTSTTTMDMDGRWMKAHDEAPPFDKYRTRTIITDTYTTFNADTKQFVSTSVDNFAGYAMSATPGWSGNKLVWTDTVSNDGTLGVTTITKTSDTAFAVHGESHDKSGKANPSFDATCTKSS
ncbi:MAG: hypothetical protein ACXWNJ_05945 [Vulcanimicrobiaceae bacterium]